MKKQTKKVEDLAKSRHSGEPRIGSRAGSGVQGIYKYLKILDSGFRRNDEKGYFLTFYEFIKVGKIPIFLFFT